MRLIVKILFISGLVLVLKGVSTVKAGFIEIHPEFILPKKGSQKDRSVFWIKVYTELSQNQFILHDTRYPKVIYGVYDFSSKGSKASQMSALKKQMKDVLIRLQNKEVCEDKLCMQAREALKSVVGDTKFIDASHVKRLRTQLGMKEQMREGIVASGEYLTEMEAVFVKNQIPIELTRIPFVESSFNTRAISKVGASGVWQFIRSTGKEFLQVNEAIDERNDPVRSAEAAAKLLKINYDSLGSWALAVTAYNHGRIGLLKMVRQAGSEDLEYLVDNVRARNFGFSSKNYFISILAALEVEQNYKKYYGDIDRKRSTLNFEVKLPSAIKLKDLCAFMGYSVRELIHLNPAWTDKTQTSQLRIPEGSMLRLPLKGDGTMASQESAKRVFAAGFVKIPKRFKK